VKRDALARHPADPWDERAARPYPFSLKTLTADPLAGAGGAMMAGAALRAACCWMMVVESRNAVAGWTGREVGAGVPPVVVARILNFRFASL